MPLFRLPDGRDLEYQVSGPSTGHAVVFHHGMPGSADPMPTVLDSIIERGFRVITYSRVGYGASSPAPGRSVADSAADCVSLLAHLSIAKYLTVGWSAGGPHALAQAALAPESVTGVLSVASFAPFDAPGLDFVEGMGAQNVTQFSITGQGEPAVRGLVAQMAAAVRDNSPADVVAGLASLFSPVDAEVLGGRFGAENAASMDYALAPGDEGWVKDLVALTSPWGVDITAIQAQVELWHGSEDRMVPLSHGQWLAEHLPTVTPHLEAEHGHLSIAVGRLGDKLDALTKEERPVPPPSVRGSHQDVRPNGTSPLLRTGQARRQLRAVGSSHAAPSGDRGRGVVEEEVEAEVRGLFRGSPRSDVHASIAEEPYDSADGQLLINAMADDMLARYNLTRAEDPEPLEAADFGVFVIARDRDGTAIGCGALRLLTSDMAELKRMYVLPRARGTGVATAILRSLEDRARARGIKAIKLATGTAQPEAVRFYQREGYRPTDGFGPFAGNPTGVFLARELS